MPEEPPSRLEASESYDHRQLPVVVAPTEFSGPSNGESWLHRLARTLFGWKPGSARSDIEGLLAARELSDAGFSPEERAMLKNILGLSERPVEHIMIPRADIVAVQKDVPLGELLKIFEKAGHSRLVVFDDTLDDPVGLVHIRDLIGYMTARATVSPAKQKRRKVLPADLDLRAIDLAIPLSQMKIMRKILFVPPSMPTLDLLAKMQATRIHLALVIDEYGGSDGLVSIEDLVEQIVGDIEDEHDEHAAHAVIRQPDGSFLADARAPLDDAIAMIGHEFDIGDAAEEVDTLGGYLVTRIGRLPVRGEIVPGPEPFEIEVLDADPRRVKMLKISRSSTSKLTRESKRESEGNSAPAAAAANSDPAASPTPPASEPPANPPIALPAPPSES